MRIVYLIGLFFIFALSAGADLKIDFETKDGYKDLDVYDVWPDSPFMTGDLRGNFGIVLNQDKTVNPKTGEVSNNSTNVLGCQRSRYGSNRFGVRIDLEEPIALSPETQYVHILLHKPKEGRVMLVGLGSRKERYGQNPFTEQFYVLSTTPIKTGQWSDAVFPIRGAEGIDIRSLVIIPDCESPHNLKEDFLFYVDNIEITTDPELRIPLEIEEDQAFPGFGGKAIVNDYQLNGEVVAADGRKLNSLEVEAGKDLKIRVLPEKGFSNGGLSIKYGVNVNSEKEFDNSGKRQFTIVDISSEKFDNENYFVIPGDYIRGNVLIQGKMIENK